jgi:hypothetical protein
MNSFNYGINRIGYFREEKCEKCDWEGYRSELEKRYVYDEPYHEDDLPTDEHWVCPVCKSIIID